MKNLFFTSWAQMLHVALSTVIAFVTLFLFVRIAGKRTLAKLNAFDFVVTVALGSTLSYMMLGLVPLLEATEVLFLIIVMQFVFAWTARSSRKMEKLINAVPTLLYYNGHFLEDAMSKEALTREEIYATMRKAGVDRIKEVKAVVMELNGEITVVKKSDGEGRSTLDDFEIV